MVTIELNKTFSKEYVVKCNDMTPEYRLSIPAALAYFQDTVASFLTTKYLAAFDIIKDNLIWVISEYSIELDERIPIWQDHVRTEIRTTEASSLKIYFDFILYGKDGKPFAKGSSCWSVVDNTTSRPVFLDTLFRTESSDSAVRHPRLRFPVQDKQLGQRSSTTTLSDIDFNRHIDNRSYVNYVLQGAPVEFLANNYLSKVSVKFVRQSYLGDTLTCKYFSTSESGYLAIMTNQNGEEVCMLYMDFKNREYGKPDIKDTVKRT